MISMLRELLTFLGAHFYLVLIGCGELVQGDGAAVRQAVPPAAEQRPLPRPPTDRIRPPGFGSASKDTIMTDPIEASWTWSSKNLFTDATKDKMSDHDYNVIFQQPFSANMAHADALYKGQKRDAGDDLPLAGGVCGRYCHRTILRLDRAGPRPGPLCADHRYFL